jgi:signal peptidase I
MNLRWFISKTMREVCAVRKHYTRLLAAQRDVLSPEALAAVLGKLGELTVAIAGGHTGKMRIAAEELQFAAEKWLKPYPNAAWRENVEVLLVALAVAMAIRTFFLQPFKIPTGSMQPTLFGVTSVPDFSQSKINYWTDADHVRAQVQEQMRERDALQFPSGLARVKEWLHGNSYVHFVAPSEGEVEEIDKPWPGFLLNISQKIKFAGEWQTLWFPPDCGEQTLAARAGLERGHVYHAGEDVIKLKVSAGDHLFVDRMSFNFRKPTRGEIIVFQTQGINNPDAAGVNRMPQDQFYIKRLVVLPNERVSIGDDRHLVINGQRLDAATPHFENVYGFNPTNPPHESQYSGHLNASVASANGQYASFPFFPDSSTVYNNEGNRYMVMGDNTCNSSDSRVWGSFPAENVIGKYFFVYWPLTERFGWGNR